MKAYISLVSALILIVLTMACSTKKDAFVNRNFHAMTSKYNILHNGELALNQGIEELNHSYSDNFWDVLPVEPMQVTELRFGQDSLPRNPNFVRAEEKAIKAIQNHSMYIGGVEKNPQMDESYLLLGKARYYDLRFIPALEAFNYILLKYPDSDKINEIKIWKEKTNIRLDNNYLAIKNLNKLIKETHYNKQTLADAYAILAQAYYNEQIIDTAVFCIKKAIEFTPKNTEKARYQFITAQLYEKQDSVEEALYWYNEILKLKRKSPKNYSIHAESKIISLDKNSQDTVATYKKFNKLLSDRENRPYKDVLNHHIALYYEGKNNVPKAIYHYKQSLKYKTKDKYQVASNYRQLAELNFNRAKYLNAGKYYDSTLVNLDSKSREYYAINRKRNNLDDVIKYETIANQNDSIIALSRMSNDEQIDFFLKYIKKLKLEEKRQQEQLKKEIALGNTNAQNTNNTADPNIKTTDILMSREISLVPTRADVSMASANSNFYFYNANSVAQGKNEFRKKWGNRPLKNYWRLSNYTGSLIPNTQIDEEVKSEKTEELTEPRFTTEFYIRQIPTNQEIIDSLITERNYAYFRLGIIYKDKFKEFSLAQNKLESLLENNPEERLVLPTMFNLYKIYEITNSDKKATLGQQIVQQYPESRYAKYILNPEKSLTSDDSPEAIYSKLLNQFNTGDYLSITESIDTYIEQFASEDILPKFELLKANVIGNLDGLDAYRKALNYVALTYPNHLEGKEAENIIQKTIPRLEKMNFDSSNAKSWKLILPLSEVQNKTVFDAKLKLFINDRIDQNYTISQDNYTRTEQFIVIHNITSEEKAKELRSILEEYKDYRIKERFQIISSEDYKIVQFKKNYDTFIQNIK
ncbi:MAG: gliding motility protein [Bacteroidota bacterium]|nr:gliding motility protein [Bacteroidota bacterium]